MREMKVVFEKLTYREEDFVYMKPCLDITFYWTGSVFERSDGIVEFYHQCLDVLGGSIKYYRTETMTKARQLKQDTLGLLPFWFQETTSRRDIYMLFLESGSAPDEPSDRAFILNAAPDKGYVRLVLPASFISDSLAPYLDLARSMGQRLLYDFGQAGFAINWNHLGKNKRGVLLMMNSLANRYPGLDMSHPFCTKYIVSKGVKCANWLTFLNTNYRDRLGGLSALRKKFDNNVVIHEVSNNGVIIQAGPIPEIGDVNRQKSLPIYHQVGRVLAPIRSREHPSIFGPRGLGDKEVTEKWLSRFDL